MSIGKMLPVPRVLRDQLLARERAPALACTFGGMGGLWPGAAAALLVSARHFPYPIKVVTAANVALWCNG